jgi:hypothetical protein
MIDSIIPSGRNRAIGYLLAACFAVSGWMTNANRVKGGCPHCTDAVAEGRVTRQALGAGRVCFKFGEHETSHYSELDQVDGKTPGVELGLGPSVRGDKSTNGHTHEGEERQY